MKDWSSSSPDPLPHNLRMALRLATRPEHDRLDRLVSGLDISHRADFAHFCRMHHAAFSAVARRCGAPGLHRAVDALAQDLEILGEAPPSLNLFLPDLDPLASSYIFEGSRLGSQLLRYSWEASTDDRVRTANRYFSLERDSVSWRSLCEMLSSIDSHGQRGERIIRDTRRVFDQFARAFILTAPTPFRPVVSEQ